MASPPFDRLESIWQLLEAGDLAAADAAFAKLRFTAKDPEAFLLKAALESASGDIEGAMASLEQAATLDPKDARSFMQRAELSLYALADPAAAIGLAERAHLLAADSEEQADALVLRADAEFELDDREAAVSAATQTMAEVARLTIHDPVTLSRAGRMHLALGDLDQAELRLRDAIARDPGLADAHHALGAVLEERGDRAAMIDAYLTTWRLDREAPRPPWHLSPDDFETIAERAMAELPEEILARLENVPILIEAFPSQEIIQEGLDPRLFGLFSGVPLPEKSHVNGQVPVVDAIHIYQHNLELENAAPETLAEEIRITVIHETAHFFGLDDDDLDDLGLG